MGALAAFAAGCRIGENPLFVPRRHSQQRRDVLRVMRLKEVISSTGLARSTIYKLIGSSAFPRPVPLTERSVGWIESEVVAWIRSRIDERDMA